MTKTMIATGANQQLNAEQFAEKFANVIHEHVTKAIEPALARIAELEKAKAAGKRVDNSAGISNKFKLPQGGDEDGDEKKPAANKTGFALPKAED